MSQSSIHVTVWGEYRHEKSHETVAKLYPDGMHSTITGHLSSTLLDDGSILTTYGNYLTGSPLIRWMP